MNKINSSPDRHTFQRDNYVKRCEEEGKEPSEDYLNLFKSFRQQDEENMVDPKWQQNNMEYDLRSSKLLCDKAKASESYAQNLYAAICNMRFLKRELWPILAEQYWSASWRSAGGIVADMREQGDYMDWYCSGIGGQNLEYEGIEKEEEWKKRTGYVSESTITEEIEKDLYDLGWIPSPWPDDE